MTISSQTSRIEYTGNGSTTAFSVPFYFAANADIVVYVQSTAGVSTLQTLTTHYTLTGATLSAGGTCTFVTAPTTGYTVIIYRDPALTQTTSYNNNDPFPASSHELALDKAVTIDQRTRDLVNRSLHLSDGDALTGLTLAGASTRANTFLGFDATGALQYSVAPTIDDITFGNVAGTAAITQGGTGQTTASAAFDALAPTTTRGDIIYRNATTNARLAAGTAGQVLQTNGAGADPVWAGPMLPLTGGTVSGALTVSGAAALASLSVTGTAAFTTSPTAPTLTSGDSTTKLATTQHVMRRSTISIMDYGAVNDGSLTVSGTGTDSRAAFVSAAAATFGTLVRVIVPPGIYRIASNLSLPIGVEWEFLPGAFLCPDTGVTVTFLDRVIAGPYRLFGTNGTILGIRDVISEWWGAAADGTTDNAPFITKAIACVQGSGSSKGGECKLTLLAGIYAIGGGNPLLFTNTSTICWRVQGAGHLATTILSKSTATGAALTVTASSVSDFRFSDFTLINATGGSGCSVGLVVSHMAGYHNSLFENIKVSGFSYNWDVINPTRLVKWDRCSAWAFDNSGVEVASTTNLQIVAASASTFTGDLEFVNCQWVGAMGSSAPTGQNVYLNAASASAHVSGIRFFGNIFYGAQLQAVLSFAAGSQCDDIWFQTCQFEAPVRGVVDTIGIELIATGASTFVRDIHVDHCYFAGNGHNRHIVGSVTGSSTGGQWLISNNFFNGSISRSVEITGAGGTYTGYVFTGNIQRDCASLGDVNLLTAMNYHSITGNTVSGTTTGTSFFHFTGTGDWYSLAGNNAAGQRTTNYLFDGGAGANRATAANL